ncbi:MAG: hypothetical protein ABSF69_18265 [Polyangiaceae bacterium]
MNSSRDDNAGPANSIGFTPWFPRAAGAYRVEYALRDARAAF